MPKHHSTPRSHPQPTTAIPPKALQTPNLITLDGRTLEGGGQLVRVALTLSALGAIPVHIHHVRGNRAGRRGSRSGGGGLKESHLAALDLLAGRCGAEVYGAEVGSAEVVFVPGCKARGVGGGRVRVELKNPGSVWLILQAVYPVLVLEGGGGEFILEIVGGTNVSMSMSAEYVVQVFGPVVERLGLPGVDVVVERRGWTHGRERSVGEVRVRVKSLPTGARLPAFKATDRGQVAKVVVSVLARPEEMRKQIVGVASGEIRAALGNEVVTEVLVDEDSEDPKRMYLLLVAHTENGWRLGRDWLMDEKRRNGDETEVAEKMGKRVVRELVEEIERDGAVDGHMQDQLVVFQALAEGRSEVDAGRSGKGTGASLHAKTVRWVVKEMLGDKVKLDGDVVDGCGFRARETLGEADSINLDEHDKEAAQA